MNYLKENTVGVDTKIKEYQEYLYDAIVKDWCLQNFDGYGRVYKNKRNDKIVPEYYVNAKEYKEVLLDDSRDGIMFFSPSDYIENNQSLSIQKCDIMFTFKMSGLGSNQTRQDEEIRTYIVNKLNDFWDTNGKTKTVTGLKNVYSDYSGVSEYFKDMQEYHHFKISLELRYQNTNCK